VGGGVVLDVVGGGVVVVVVVGGGVVVVVATVSGLLDVVVDAVVLWHPMVEDIKTRLNRTRRKLEYLLFINALLFFKFRFSNIIKKRS
jgi:hypothetical protein